MFGDLYLQDSKEIDILGRWMNMEWYVRNYHSSELKSVYLLAMEPWWSDNPWTKCLENKKVLVVHPFAELIMEQYNTNRDKLFKNPDVLPLFHLETLKAVQSIGGNGTDSFEDWFQALNYMKCEIDKRDYDICLIGCGAYGLPIAAHVKRHGKKAVHLGGVLQLLFGIRGKRWDNPEYGDGVYDYKKLFNNYWVYPGIRETPKCANEIENGCYW